MQVGFIGAGNINRVHLKQAQELGDYRALKNRNRRVLRVHLEDPIKGFKALRQAVEKSVKSLAHA